MIESTYSCLLRLRTYEGVDLLYKRKILTRLQYHKLKNQKEMSVLKIPKCSLLLILIDSSPTPALSSLTSLIYTIITMCLSIYVSIFCSFSDIYHFSLFDSYILVSWLLRKSCLHTGSSFYVILKKELFSSHTVNYRRGSGLVFQLKTVFKDLKLKTYI